jgi:selenocysteine lyase/cysteine desulfurase
MAQLTRRGLLGAAAIAGIAGVAACEGDPPAAPVAAPAALDPGDWASVRAQFALPADVAHLSTYVFAPHPMAVRDAIARHRDGLDRDPIGYLHANEGRLDQAVAVAAARHLGSDADRIAFTDSTTMGLGLLYGGLRLGAGDEILTTEHDFYATHEALRLRAERDGVTVRRTALHADPARATVDEIVGRLTAAVGQRTRVVALTWVHSSTGVRLPVAAIARALAGRDVLLCVDAVHGFGAVDETPDDLGCDFLVSGCHKWLLGPRGTGLVWGSERGWSRFAPTIPPFAAESFQAWFGFGGTGPPPGPAATPGGYHSFEHRWALAEAFDLHARVGRDRVAARTRELATRLKEGLAGIPGVTLVTPSSPDLSAGLVCCAVDGVPPAEAVDRLRQHDVVASATPYRTSYLRFGPTIANDEEHVDAAVRAVQALR